MVNSTVFLVVMPLLLLVLPALLLDSAMLVLLSAVGGWESFCLAQEIDDKLASALLRCDSSVNAARHIKCVDLNV